MSQTTLYTEDLWSRYCEKIAKSENEYGLKTYPQFDPVFNFLKSKDAIRTLVSDPTLGAIANHSFLPFIKILLKVPRYKYQENEGRYQLETKIRPISFAAHFDTYIYGFYSFALTEKYQDFIKKKGFDQCVLAYRTDLDGKCNIQFAKEVFTVIQSRTNNDISTTAIAFDISGYFDNIEHRKLKESWCKMLDVHELPIDQYKIFRSLTKYSYATKDNFLKHFRLDLTKIKKSPCLLDLIENSIVGSSMVEKLNYLRKKNIIVTNAPKVDNSGKVRLCGIPQGASMSALLSNIYLIDFDNWLYRLSKENGFIYNRYCDDLLIVCDTKISEQLAAQVVSEISKYGLTIQSRKTEVIEFKRNSKGKVRSFDALKLREQDSMSASANESKFYKNLQYLGFEYNGQNVFIRPGSLSRYFRKMKGRIVKTMMMAYGDRSDKNFISKKQIYELYTHIGRRNFLSYAFKAASKTYVNRLGKRKEGLDSRSIKKQISAHFAIIAREISETNLSVFQKKERKFYKLLKEGKNPKVVVFKK